MDIEKILSNVATEAKQETEQSTWDWLVDNAAEVGWVVFGLTPWGRLANAIRAALATGAGRVVVKEAFIAIMGQVASEVLGKFIAGGSDNNNSDAISAYQTILNSLKSYPSFIRSLFFELLKDAAGDAAWGAFIAYLKQNRGNLDNHSLEISQEAQNVANNGSA